MTTAAQRYKELEAERNHYLQRGRESASLTIPYLVPLSDDLKSAQAEIFTQPWHGIGARGVNNLASRLMLALLPPTEAFFRLTIDDVKQAAEEQRLRGELLGQGMTPDQAEEKMAEMRSEFELALAKLERTVLRSIEASNDRVAVFEALVQLVVPGNVLLYVGEDATRAYHLSRYVLQREPNGMPLDAVVCESVAYSSLPERAQGLVREGAGEAVGVMEVRGDDSKNQELHKVYTWIKWEGDTVKWGQEINSKEIPGQDGNSSAEDCPWIPLRMYSIDGASYSPGYVETKCLADLKTVNVLAQAVTEGALITAQCKFGRKPGSALTAKEFANAANGATITANPEDFFPIQANKAAELQVAQAAMAQMVASLAQAFMLSDARDSERTTAEEVRLQALQIENSLGAIYAILTSEFQAPFIRRKLALLSKSGAIPSLPKGLIKPVVSVGLAAVGRGNDLENLVRFMQVGQQTGGPEFLARVNQGELYRRLGYASNVDPVGLIKSDKQVQEEQAAAQEAQQQMAMQQAALASPAADPQKLATAAATVQEMAAPPPDTTTEQPTQ